MSSLAITLTTQRKCAGHLPIFFNPTIRKKEDFKDYKAKQEENFLPDEFLNEEKLISQKQVSDGSLPEDCELLNEDWAKEIRLDYKARPYYKDLLVSQGLTDEEIKYTMDAGRDNLKRSLVWTRENEKYGSEAARFAAASTVLGIAKSIFENTEATPAFINTMLNVLQGFTLGQRGSRQYHLYGRNDDDKGVSAYQREHYGNKISGDLAELACTFETKIKPYVLPLLGLLETDNRDAVASLLTLPTTLFWRIRYGGYINQKFATNLITYIANKPLALLGDRASQNALKELEKDSDILTMHYLKQRLKVLLRLKEGEAVSGKMYSLTKDLFSDDINSVRKSAEILNETFAPILGIAGFAFSAIGIPLKAFTIFIPGENFNPLLKRTIDSFSTWGIATQQLLYTLRFSVMEYIKGKQIKEIIADDEELDTAKKNELNGLANDRYSLSAFGFSANSLSCLLPFVKLLDDSNSFFKISKSLVSEISCGLSQYFFSKRRELKANFFKIKNAELFQNTEPSIEEPPPPQLKIYRRD